MQVPPIDDHMTRWAVGSLLPTLCAECERFGVRVAVKLVRDDVGFKGGEVVAEQHSERSGRFD